MTAAILTVHLRNGFFVTASGYEYNLILILIGIAFAIAGAGGSAWSLDAALGLDLTGAAWALGRSPWASSAASGPYSPAAAMGLTAGTRRTRTPPERRLSPPAARSAIAGRRRSSAAM
jgi:hypothetical protein